MRINSMFLFHYQTPLSYAAGGGSILVIEELSRIRIIDPNLGDNDGNTCLHYASQAGTYINSKLFNNFLHIYTILIKKNIIHISEF